MPVINTNGKSFQTERFEATRRCSNKIYLGEYACFTYNIDITLNELPKSSSLWTLRTPDRTHLNGFKRKTEVRHITGEKSRQRQCQIEAQPIFNDARLCCTRVQLQLFAALDDFKNKLLIPPAISSSKKIDSFHRWSL